ncbi:MAG: hypothetical protein H6745_20400 [Deltaproteobacteria bacterium]|nr:hypothetical protein [Deltaproteobacteria bacterium]
MRTLSLTTSLALGLTAALAVSACGDDGGGGDAADADTAADTTLADTTAPDTTIADTTAADTDAADVADTAGPQDTGGDTLENPWGFAMRTPVMHTIPCDPPAPGFDVPDLETPDADWLCTFPYSGLDAVVYIRATPTGCRVTLSGTPVFDGVAGDIALDGAVTALADTAYDWGGNHHNDSLTFTYAGKSFTYYHSSFGFGFRSCQEMDCLQVRDQGGALLEDGCGADRALPAVCRQIGVDGTWEPLSPDTFAWCQGDPNHTER